MEATETSLLILNLGVRFEQMGNADAERTVALLPGKMATLRKILLHPGEEPPGLLLTCRCGSSSYVRGRRPDYVFGRLERVRLLASCSSSGVMVRYRWVAAI